MSLLSEPAIIEIKNLNSSDHSPPTTPIPSKALIEKQNITISTLDKNAE